MPRNQIRIIGGQWRGRKINFTAGDSIRPTHDRVRETLFNWLQNEVMDALCLDCFAGSGALGFEALSRGAKHVTFIDSDHDIAHHLRESADMLAVENFDVMCGACPDKISYLPFKQYDIVFLDPPYHQNLIVPCLQWLLQLGCLSADAKIYFEAEKTASIEVPEFTLIKHKETKSLQYGLLNYACD